MRNLIEWSSKLDVGVKLIDEQHKKLVDLTNKLHNAMLDRKTKEVLGSILGELVEYTIFHFGTEEKMFKELQYIDREAHMAEHKTFVAKAAQFQEGHQRGSFLLSIEMMKFLEEWLVKHILGSDKKFAGFCNNRGIN